VSVTPQALRLSTRAPHNSGQWATLSARAHAATRTATHAATHPELRDAVWQRRQAVALHAQLVERAQLLPADLRQGRQLVAVNGELDEAGQR
jgi:hypothetical protein